MSKVALEIAYELVRKAHACLLASNEQRILSEGGVITAAKAYIKAAVVAFRKLDPLEVIGDKQVKTIEKMLDDIVKLADKKLEKYNSGNKVIESKIKTLKTQTLWAKNTLRKMVPDIESL